MPDSFVSEDDISGVVVRLKRTTEKAKARLANDTSTKAFIAAGVSLVNKELGFGGTNSPERKHLGWLSMRTVIAEAKELGETTASQGKLRDRWAKHSDYIADLVSYMLWSERLKLDRSQAKLASQLLRSNDPADLIRQVHEVAHSDLTAMVATAAYRFQLVAAATASNDSVIEDALAKMYSAILQSWIDAYETIINRLGLRLRPDVSMMDIATILAATAEGLGVHMLSDPHAAITNEATRTGLLGTTAIALIASCTTSGEDSRTLEATAGDVISMAHRARLE